MLLKNGAIDGYAYKPCFSWLDLHCADPLAFWRFSQNLLAKYGFKTKKGLTICELGSYHSAIW